jgi:hypothetical protein
MERYRVYAFDSEGHIKKPPEIIECPDDRAIIEKGRQLLNREVIEIWSRARRVIRLEPTQADRPILGS